jgi:hypothetical protein
MVMTLKPNDIPDAGRVLLHLAPRKCGRWAWQHCLFFFSVIEGLCIMNSLLKVRQSRFLFGGSETSAACSTKKVTGNEDCGELDPPSW